jgi:mannose-6-phosphate isomerase-like protein (cupin superfamily)
MKAAGYGWTKVSTKDTGGAWSMFESPVDPQVGPPLHLHHHQEEWFHVLAGEFLFEVGGQQYDLKPGMSILGPRQIPHRWQNRSQSVGRLLILLQPAGMMEEFFEVPRPRPVGSEKQEKEFWERYGMALLGPPLAAH